MARNSERKDAITTAFQTKGEEAAIALGIKMGLAPVTAKTYVHRLKTGTTGKAYKAVAKPVAAVAAAPSSPEETAETLSRSAKALWARFSKRVTYEGEEYAVVKEGTQQSELCNKEGRMVVVVNDWLQSKSRKEEATEATAQPKRVKASKHTGVARTKGKDKACATGPAAPAKPKKGKPATQSSAA